MQDAFIKADQHFSQLVEQITDEQWEHMVPADPEWTVKQLVGHVTENNLAVCKTLSIGSDLIQNPDSQPRDAWRESAADAETCARAVVDLKQTAGDMSAKDFLNMQLVDRSIHAFDLAQAIGADTTLDPELAKIAYEFLVPRAEEAREQGMFGPKIEVSDEASFQDRLLGLSGRQPA